MFWQLGGYIICHFWLPISRNLTGVIMALLSLLSPQTRRVVANTLMVLLIALAMAALPQFAFAQRGPDVVIIAEEDKMIYEFRK